MSTTPCGVACQGAPPLMLQVAVGSLRREGIVLIELPHCNGEPCSWVREIAECLRRGDCRAAVLFCDASTLACCLTNKLPGIRAASVASVLQAEQAARALGANLLIVEPAGRTFFEFKQFLRLGASAGECPPGVACILQELDGHAHR